MASHPWTARRQIDILTLLIIAALVSALPGCSRKQGPATPATQNGPPDTLPPLEHLPLDPPLQITSSFGEYRRGHFHAGLDFSTELKLGLPVYAPVSGYVERIHTSGAGFGRALMLRAEDGRTILFAHLDGFEEPIASFVAAAQDSSGQYEQELAPAANALPVKAGQRVAWTGESGAGPPHLHMEIRHGDWAYNPLRHGLTLPDSVPPVLRRITFEPVDDVSYVQGSAAPRTFSFPADTVVVEGRVRLWLEAADGVSDPSPRLAPYAVSMEAGDEKVECRFDRIAWDDDMTAVEWVYDGNGRVAPGHALGLWIDSEYQPSVLTSSGSASDAGVVEVKKGDPPRKLMFRARDAAGNSAERRMVVQPPRPGEEGPRSFAGRRRRAASRPFELMTVHGPFVRVHYSGAGRGSRDVSLGLEGATVSLRPASFDGARWSAVVRVPERTTAAVARGTSGGKPWEMRHPLRLEAISPKSPTDLSAESAGAKWTWSLPEGAVFASAFVYLDSLEQGRPGATELSPAGATLNVSPARLPLRRAAKVSIDMPHDPGRARIHFSRGKAWLAARPIKDTTSTARTLKGEVRSLGRLSVLEDVVPPRIGRVQTTRIRTGAPNRWALQCRVVERGSGLDPGRTHFLVDGRQVPSEWNTERGVLRWRPLHVPASGRYRYQVVAVDGSGLESRRAGTFVVR